MSTESEASLLTIDQVATRLSLSSRGVWRLISEGQFPRPIKIGRLSRWITSDIADYLKRISKLR